MRDVLTPTGTDGATYGVECQGCGHTKFDPTRWRNVMGQGADLQRCRLCGLKSYDSRLVLPASVYDSPTARAAAEKIFRLGSMINKDESPQACSNARARVRSYYATWLEKAQKLAGPFLSAYEVGAGNGDALWVAKEEGMSVSGCEPNGRKAELVREHIGCDMAHACFQDAPPVVVDLLLMFDVIEHTRTPSADIAKAYRTLVPGGLLVLKTFYDEWHDTIELAPEDLTDKSAWRKPHGYFGPPQHLHHFDVPVLVALVHRHGFTIVDITWAPSWGQVTLFCLRQRPGGHGRLKP